MQSNDLIDLLLHKRGIKDPQIKQKFLQPSFERDLYDPFLLKDMERGVVRLFEAIEAGQKILIYADYDCDGIPGAVMMHDLFEKIGYKNFSVYIPDRHDEGYGLHMDAIRQFIDEKVNLIITIDLGSTAVAEVAQAQGSAIDVIITDHHLPHAEIPKAFAFINPKREDDEYPFDMLCGSGVVFKFIQAFLSKYRAYYKIPIGWEKWLLDLAALATLSDMVPLLDENRALAFYGLMVLRKTRRPGLTALFRSLAINQRYLTEDDITFMISPRINAASRMDTPMQAFCLLSERDEAKATACAAHLTKINDDRKTMVAQIMRDVHNTLEKRDIKEVIVIGNPTWRTGVLGLVASKIAETYERPVFVWGTEGASGEDMIKGSCRSDGNVNVVALMECVKDSFLAYGGHELAGGFSIRRDTVPALEDILIDACKKLDIKNNEKAEAIDTTLALHEVGAGTYKALSLLAPFGLANPKPVFSFERVGILGIKQFGKEKNHLELLLSDGKVKIKAISFFAGSGSFSRPLVRDESVTVLASFDLSRFGGREELRLRIVDVL